MRHSVPGSRRALPVAALVAAALVAGCARQPDLTPRPRAVTPGGARPGEQPRVVITGEGFFPRAVQSSRGGPAVLDTTHRAWFDGDPAGKSIADLAWKDTGRLEGTLPPDLGSGPHSLTVENALGRQGTLEAAVVISPPARLEVAVTVAPSQVSVGQEVAVTVTVSNTAAAGSATASNVRVALEPSLPDALSGSLSAGPLELGPQEETRVTLTLTAVAPGAVALAASASGEEARTLVPLEAAAPLDANLLVQARASLQAALAIPATIAAGAPFQVTMMVDNVGEATALDVAPDALRPVATATGAFSQVSGPSPASATLQGGGRATFTWTWQLAGAGTVELLGGAAGTDANDGGPVVAAPVESNEAGQSPEVVHVAADPFGDATAVAALATWRGQLWVGPSSDGRLLWHFDPAAPGGGVLPVSVAVDGGATPAENVGWRGSPTSDTFGMTGCAPNTTGCGPSNENGRGVLASGSFHGDEWLLSAGASTIRARYAYLARQAGPTIPFAAVDLGEVLATTALATTAVVFAPAAPGGADRVYLAFTDQDAKKSPRLIALGTAPAGPVLDAAVPADALDLAVTTAPGVGGDAGLLSNPDSEPRVEALAWFRNRLYVATGSGLLRAAAALPGPYAANQSDWSIATPLSAAWLLRRALPATASSNLTPADRAVPAMAAYGACGAGPCLYVARNLQGTAGAVLPQLWACHPTRSGDAEACDGGDWSLAAANRSGDRGLTQLGVATNGAASLLLATGHHLYLGFDNAVTGAQVYRTEVVPADRTDFRGRDGCVAGDAGCQGLGGDGFGLGTAVPRIFDARAVTAGGVTTVYVAAGDASGPLHLFAIRE